MGVVKPHTRDSSIFCAWKLTRFAQCNAQIDKSTALHCDALGKKADPPSLFEAQVQLRLAAGDKYRTPLPAFAPGYEAAQAGMALDQSLTIVTNYHPKVRPGICVCGFVGTSGRNNVRTETSVFG